MKCNNCGVNYDDGDKECPVCGTAAGRGHRSAMPHYTTYDTGSDQPTRRTVSRRGAAQVPQPVPQRKKTAKSSNKFFVVFFAIILILSAQPALFRTIAEGLNGFISGISGGSPATPEYDGQASDFIWVNPGETFGAMLSTTLTDGSQLLLQFDDSAQTYTLTRELDGSTVYEETGYASCLYNFPEEEYYEEGFEPPTYDSYTLYLDVADWAGSDQVTDEPNSNVMLLAYQNMETGNIALSNAFGAVCPYLGEQRLASFVQMQSA